MDFVYLAVSLALWLAVAGMALGCERLQSHGAQR